MQWSQYQEAIFDEAARSTREDCAIVARAGAAKTTSLLESLHHAPQNRVLLCAFNKSIQTEMSRRAPRHVTCRTLHALGLRVHQINLERQGKRAEVKPDKAREMCLELLAERPALYRGGDQPVPDDYARKIEMVGNARRVASLAKNVLASTQEELVDIANDLDLKDREQATRVARTAGALMRRAQEDVVHIDFDDMVWFPWVLKYGVEADTIMLDYDIVFVDERQDICPAQDYLIDKMSSGRVMSFLDDRQCIYGFRGVDRKVVQAAVDRAPVQLSLPVSYRCPVAVVEKAQLVVPDIVAPDGARDGWVEFVEYGDMMDNAQVGDFILSRTNAPLARICLRLLQAGLPAIVAGRDIGESLQKMLKKSKAETIHDLHAYLNSWLKKEYERHMPEEPGRYERSRDMAGCLSAIANHCLTPEEVDAKIRRIFQDSRDNVVMCSTVHRAKGLESDRVWLLSQTFGFPDPKPWQDVWAEENIWYVAVTRSKDCLYFVETDVSDLGADTKRTRQVSWR